MYFCEKLAIGKNDQKKGYMVCFLFVKKIDAKCIFLYICT